MLHLKQCDRLNILYSLAKSLGALKPDGSDSKFPAKRMPAGLLQHMVNFFAADNLSQVLVFVLFFFYSKPDLLLLSSVGSIPETIASG